MPAKDTSLIPLQDDSEEFDAIYERNTFYNNNDVEFSVVVGIIIGTVIVQNTPETPTNDDLTKWSYNGDVREAVFKEIKAENIRNNLQKLTKKPHLAGSNQDEDVLVDFIKQTWENYLDKVEVFPYNILLSFPNSSDLNYVGIRYPNGSIMNKSNSIEKPLTENEKNQDVIPTFNAYSPAGDVVGNLFYVNYGSVEDFEMLQKKEVNVSGGICIARYGHLFRGDKANNAAKFNCSGLILYSDPHDYAGVEKNSWTPESKLNVYPDTWWLPPTGVQRGSLGLNGDPLTPDYPSLNITYRIPEKDAIFPRIPVQPISYSEAFQYLSILDGPNAPDQWQGGFNITYKTGGSFNAAHHNCQVELHVSNFRKRKTVKTVIGYIKGWLEPDRYVLLGNHRDAWTFGGADPSSGTAVVLEVARAISSVVKSGKWRPRRTIVFCNWAAEEFGLMGSTEWNEQMEKKLLLRAVSYLNIDIAVEGNKTFRAKSTPEMHQLLYNVTKLVPNPRFLEVQQKRTSVYDTWLATTRDLDNPKQPFIQNIGSGSDFTMFLQKSGVSAVDLRYTYEKRHSSYPVYHSIHDTFDYFENFLDRDFNCSRAMADIAADSVLQLSGSVVLPVHPIDVANELKLLSGKLENSHGSTLTKHDITLQELNRTIEVLNISANRLSNEAMKLNSSSNDIHVRRVNDKLFLLNRGFLDFNGIPGRHYYRHVIFAPSSHDSYSGAGFPGIADAIFSAMRGGSWEDVKKQLSIVCLNILSVADLLKLD
ncbi:unnamed protein product [Clavelina lepadiformis]|uniref:N-acetylated-alpha-linked acidic dipeptidase 2 n=1 Tax=Clavelina lepadiformis TaxID=159417 RepID=A0ABP0G1M7_CLALP